MAGILTSTVIALILKQQANLKIYYQSWRMNSMYKLIVTIFSACLMLIVSSPAWSDGPSMKPGKWEFTTTITMPMMPQPQTMTNIECITKEQAREDPLGALLKEGMCDLVSKKVRGNRIDFEVACQGDMNVTSTGTGHFITKGNTASGEMEVIMNMPEMANVPNMKGQEMKMEQSWKGRRIGACD